MGRMRLRPSRLPRRALMAGALLGALTLGGCGQSAQPVAQETPAPSPLAQADLRAQAEQAESAAQQHQTPKPRPIPRLKDPVYGGDVSWPQCPEGMGIPKRPGKGLPMPLPEAKFVVIGLTNGPGFTPNPCIDAQLAWAKQRHLLVGAYSVLSFPSKQALARHGGTGPFNADRYPGRLANVGYQQALFNVRTLERVQLVTPFVWVDVEPYPVFPWSTDKVANAHVVKGALRGYRDAGFRTGFYSIGGLWTQVVGDLRLGLPEWRAAGVRSQAAERCGDDWSFQGGEPVMTQWTDDVRDFNMTCPGNAAQLDRFFHQY